VTIAVTLLGDLVAIRWSYDLSWRPAVALTLLHFAFFVALFLPLDNLLGIV
jgi:hypothetical protein